MRRLLLFLLPLSLCAQELPDPDDAAYPAIERFVQVLEQVRERHPDADKLAYERLVNHALEGLLGSLDPHSSFIHPEMAAMLKEEPDLVPHIASLGLTLGWRDDGPYLANVLPSSPASALLPGSSILELDEQDVSKLPPADLISRLQRLPGQTSTFLLKSPTEPQPIEASLTHRAVENRAVTQANLIEGSSPTTGYIRLASFTDASPREIEAALDELEDAGMEHLILDLRGNPGGSLSATVKILGFFLPPSTEVVTTRGRGSEIDEEPLKTPDRQRRKRDYPIGVVIDRNSASASELTAGALQDLKRATIIGETSYGKGSVQNIIPMGGGTALRLTIATYHTPSGNTPHLKGITPDVEIEFTDDLREKFAMSVRRDQLTPEESAKLENWEDPVIKAALQSKR
ncbi:S41 family peptidase [Haloferula sp.]|uniref:S41 family peptidase n=1 Tax=Haloferula sp. TaxID=2497595 RepID=UPI00329E8845